MAYQPNEMNPAASAYGHDPAMPPVPASAPAEPAQSEENRSSDQIRRDIRRTRAEMDQTVDAIEERLRPRHLIDDLLEMFRSSSSRGSAAGGATETFKDAGYKVLDKLKQHPMPAVLIGAGIVWMLFEGDDHVRARDYQPRKWDVPEHSGSFVDARTGQAYDPSYGAAARGASGGDGPSIGEKAKDQLAGVAESAKETIRSAGETVSGWTGSAREGASSAGHAMRDYASSAQDQMRRGYESSRDAIARGMNEYPLAMGAAAMALGVLSGLCLPRTRTEDRVMGEMADEVKDRAKEAGHEVVQRGKDVARAAGEEAKRQGLTPGAIADKARRVAEDVKDAASESAKREGLDPDSLAHKGKDVVDRAKESAKDQAQREKQRFDA